MSEDNDVPSYFFTCTCKRLSEGIQKMEEAAKEEKTIIREEPLSDTELGAWHGPAFSPEQLEALDIMCKAVAENVCKEQRDWLDNEYRKEI